MGKTHLNRPSVTGLSHCWLAAFDSEFAKAGRPQFLSEHLGHSQRHRVTRLSVAWNDNRRCRRWHGAFFRSVGNRQREMGYGPLNHESPRRRIVGARCRGAIILPRDEELASCPFLMMPQQSCHGKIRCVGEAVMPSRLFACLLISVGIAPCGIDNEHRACKRSPRCFEGRREFDMRLDFVRPFAQPCRRSNGQNTKS